MPRKCSMLIRLHTRNFILSNIQDTIKLLSGQIFSKSEKSKIKLDCERIDDILSLKEKQDHRKLKDFDLDEKLFYLDEDLENKLVNYYSVTFKVVLCPILSSSTETFNSDKFEWIINQITDISKRLASLNEVSKKSASCKVPTKFICKSNSKNSATCIESSDVISVESANHATSTESNLPSPDVLNKDYSFIYDSQSSFPCLTRISDRESPKATDTISCQNFESNIPLPDFLIKYSSFSSFPCLKRIPDPESPKATDRAETGKCNCKSELAILKSELESLKKDVDSRSKVKKVFKLNVDGDNSILNKKDSLSKVGSFMCFSLPWSVWVSTTETRGMLGIKQSVLNIYVKCDYEETQFSTKIHLKITLINKHQQSDLSFPLNYNKITNSNATVGKYGIINVKNLKSDGYIVNNELTIGLSLQAKRFFKK